MSDLVATFIARPAEAALLTATVTRAAREINGSVSWLAAGEACDLILSQPDHERSRLRLQEISAGLPIDLVIQPVADRRKRLLVADMDSTMIEQECIDELADFAGLKAEISAVTESAMRGEIAFEPALRQRVRLLGGLPASVIDEVLAKRIRLAAGAKVLVATMRANGAHTALVSGGFTAFTGPVAAAIGFDEHHSNRLIVKDGKISGNVAEPILGKEAKLATLTALTERLGLWPAETMAVGDGANDAAMVAAAGLGVAYHAKPKLAEIAAARIEHCDLTALLFIQGYRRSDFVAPQ